MHFSDFCNTLVCSVEIALSDYKIDIQQSNYFITLRPERNFLTHCGPNKHHGRFSVEFSLKKYLKSNFTSFLCRSCPIDYLLSIGSGKGVVPLGNKPLPEPMMTKIPITRPRGAINKWYITELCFFFATHLSGRPQLYEMPRFVS